MRPHLPLLLLSAIITLHSYAQKVRQPDLDVGDPAPEMRVKAWLKGAPVGPFKKEKVYVLEFWATWCAPCKAAMPHLSELARQYRNKVTMIGIDIKERKNTSIRKIKTFVDSMGERLDYFVAADDRDFMVNNWLKAADEQGIPKTFVVDAKGKLAWIGYPTELVEVLPKILNKTWDVKSEMANRKAGRLLRALDESAMSTLFPYMHDPVKRRDSALFVIQGLVSKYPQLKYAPALSSNTFFLLLETDPRKAYEFGRMMIKPSAYGQEPLYDGVYKCIKSLPDTLSLPPEIYRLGAEACQMRIDRFPYPEIDNRPRLYSNMAELYWRANEKEKAIDAQQKGIDAMIGKNGFSRLELVVYQSRLQQFTSYQYKRGFIP